uniref:Cytochrome b-c1 complex subunit 7 n=1 Tax=Polytomella parva TaxID=51329 RepID=A0A6U0U149_9CHLO|mmetsp:Transcript_13393/g.23728  ORF Transcript_13393/g.23728 Transcript_13393/m.23728 type:complete len:123 (+) Transcript_13393:66-434(+)|eukprot:CAMPEP_0175053166 /NCGR_PEP_ID=MMETSP0052_2-20121109/8772_1 /TAXON_ID=51329 ORGANISM="Polytomella parva, Strain SAG 63-3" /NCGR_SAMPLE_ID=MMETSP0052_2 /ASSEMBLY_ACC=CAM_ASM_000194 /LENGTH=122 /DNA_ID=CAMNT_0016317667 /DNA_START=158 /DNA_END=526 /DNA_ORIENTATION=+
MAAIMKVFDLAFGPVIRALEVQEGKKLAQYGLRIDDLHDPLNDEDVAEALRRLPDDVLIARNCRLRRASDLSTKKVKIAPELEALQTPSERYLREILSEVRAERKERAELGASIYYTRTYYH